MEGSLRTPDGTVLTGKFNKFSRIPAGALIKVKDGVTSYLLGSTPISFEDLEAYVPIQE